MTTADGIAHAKKWTEIIEADRLHRIKWRETAKGLVWPTKNKCPYCGEEDMEKIHEVFKEVQKGFRCDECKFYLTQTLSNRSMPKDYIALVNAWNREPVKNECVIRAGVKVKILTYDDDSQHICYDDGCKI